jgi:hypothetical protein
VGLLAATQKGLLCVDIFYNHALFGKFRIKLLISYALDAIEHETSGKGKFKLEKWIDFYDGIWKSKLVQPKKTAGEFPYQFNTSKNSGIGKVLFYKKQLIHASFYSA